MWISRISIQCNDFIGAYEEHKLIWTFFPDRSSDSRSFIYRRDLGENQPTYTIVSKIKPILPDMNWKLEIKKYDINIENGQHFDFILRFNPVAVKNKKRYNVISKDINIKRMGEWICRVEGDYKQMKNCIR